MDPLRETVWPVPGERCEQAAPTAQQEQVVSLGGWRISLMTNAGDRGLRMNVDWMGGEGDGAPSCLAMDKLVYNPPSSTTADRHISNKRKMHASLCGKDSLRPHKARRLDIPDAEEDAEEDRSDWCDLHQMDHALLLEDCLHGPVASESRTQREARRWLSFERLPMEVQFEIFLRLPLTEVMTTLPLVCTQWKVLAYDETLWHALHVQHFCGPKIKPSNTWRKECALIMRQQHRRKQAHQIQLDEERKLQKYKEFMWAVRRGYLQIVQDIISSTNSIDLNACCERMGMPLAEAARSGHLHIMKYLLSKGAEVDALDKAGHSALTYTIVRHERNENSEATSVVKLLLNEGANVNIVTKENCTPLMYAAGKGLGEISKTLLEAGAAMNVQDRDGYYPLMYAVSGEHVSTTRALLEHGADANATSERGWTCLMHAAGTGNEEIFDLLLKYGAKVDATFHDGRTPLYFAVGHENSTIVKRLLDAGANVNHRDEEGWTPLHAAVETASVSVIELLLAKGANPSLQNDDEDDALALAPNDEIAAILRRALGQRDAVAQNDIPANDEHIARDNDAMPAEEVSDGEDDDEEDPDYMP